MILILTTIYVTSKLVVIKKLKKILLVLLLVVGSTDLGINASLLANSLCMNDLNYQSYRKIKKISLKKYKMMIILTTELHKHLIDICMRVI